MKRTFTFFVVLAMIISISVAVDADNLGTIQLTGLNNLSVRQAVDRYFSQRSEYLSGKTDVLDLTIPSVQSDEADHRSKLDQMSILWKESTIQYNSIDCSDNYCVVTLTETVIFCVNNTEQVEIIPHRLHLYTIYENEPTVALDAYCENTSGFTSCSYVSASAQALATNDGDGSPLCIIAVARTKVGYTETYDNITCFGAWAGVNGQGWCGAFVSWCANRSDVPNITRTGSLDQLLADCRNHGEVHNSNANNGNYVPKAGDFFFTIGEDGDLGHVGIVASVSGTVMCTIEGNASDMVRENTYRTINDTDLLYFGSPSYTTNSHTGTYSFDALLHYHTCENCGVQESSRHILVEESNSLQHWIGCTKCDYESTKVKHTFIQESPGGLYVCSECGYSTVGIILKLISEDEL